MAKRVRGTYCAYLFGHLRGRVLLRNGEAEIVDGTGRKVVCGVEAAGDGALLLQHVPRGAVLSIPDVTRPGEVVLFGINPRKTRRLGTLSDYTATLSALSGLPLAESFLGASVLHLPDSFEAAPQYCEGVLLSFADLVTREGWRLGVSFDGSSLVKLGTSVIPDVSWFRSVALSSFLPASLRRIAEAWLRGRTSASGLGGLVVDSERWLTDCVGRDLSRLAATEVALSRDVLAGVSREQVALVARCLEAEVVGGTSAGVLLRHLACDEGTADRCRGVRLDGRERAVRAWLGVGEPDSFVHFTHVEDARGLSAALCDLVYDESYSREVQVQASILYSRYNNGASPPLVA